MRGMTNLINLFRNFMDFSLQLILKFPRFIIFTSTLRVLRCKHCVIHVFLRNKMNGTYFSVRKFSLAVGSLKKLSLDRLKGRSKSSQIWVCYVGFIWITYYKI